ELQRVIRRRLSVAIGIDGRLRWGGDRAHGRRSLETWRIFTGSSLPWNGWTLKASRRRPSPIRLMDRSRGPRRRLHWGRRRGLAHPPLEAPPMPGKLALHLVLPVVLLCSAARPAPSDEGETPSALERDPSGWTDLLAQAGPELKGWTR